MNLYFFLREFSIKFSNVIFLTNWKMINKCNLSFQVLFGRWEKCLYFGFSFILLVTKLYMLRDGYARIKGIHVSPKILHINNSYTWKTVRFAKSHVNFYFFILHFITSNIILCFLFMKKLTFCIFQNTFKLWITFHWFHMYKKHLIFI